jgi:glycerophosphoryl diester phosphodiesterase
MNTSLNANNTLIIAHRGDSYDATENTLRAVNLAWLRNTDGVEIDVHLSKDKEIIVFHNNKIKNSYGKSVAIKSETLKNLKKYSVGKNKKDKPYNERIPTLKEVLLSVPPNKYLFIEIKCGTEIIPYLKNVLRNSQIESSKIKIIGFNLKKVSIIKKHFPDYDVLLNKRVTMQNIIIFKTFYFNLIKKLNHNLLDGLNLSYTHSINLKYLYGQLTIQRKLYDYLN